jgi:hypothetical protein
VELEISEDYVENAPPLLLHNFTNILSEKGYPRPHKWSLTITNDPLPQILDIATLWSSSKTTFIVTRELRELHVVAISISDNDSDFMTIYIYIHIAPKLAII